MGLFFRYTILIFPSSLSCLYFYFTLFSSIFSLSRSQVLLHSHARSIIPDLRTRLSIILSSIFFRCYLCLYIYITIFYLFLLCTLLGKFSFLFCYFFFFLLVIFFHPCIYFSFGLNKPNLYPSIHKMSFPSHSVLLTLAKSIFSVQQPE